METNFALRLPGINAKCVIVKATTFDEALKAANAPAGTTGRGVFAYVAEMMIEKGVATRA